MSAAKDVRRLQRLYGTSAAGTQYQTLLRLVRDRGLDGAIDQLEAWGLRTEEDPDGARPALQLSAVMRRMRADGAEVGAVRLALEAANLHLQHVAEGCPTCGAVPYGAEDGVHGSREGTLFLVLACGQERPLVFPGFGGAS